MDSLLFSQNGADDNDIFGFLNIEDHINITDDFHEATSSVPLVQDDTFLSPLASLIQMEPWSHIQPAIDIDMPFFPEGNDSHINHNTLHNHVPSSPEEQHILSPSASSPSSHSNSPTSSPTSYPPGITIKAEPASPSRKRPRTNKSHSNNTRASTSLPSITKVKNEPAAANKTNISTSTSPFLDSGYSSDDADFDPNAMPHPSIFTKSPSQLSKEELLSLTSRGLEEYERRLKTFHTLTHSEQNLLKRQRRLVKNRESAQQSRMRKKVYVQDLERKVSHLLNERDELYRHNQELIAKNEMLQAQLNLFQQNLTQSTLTNNELLPTTKAMIKREHHPSAATRTAQAAGVCALVMVFSFALFFGLSDTISPSPSMPGAGAGSAMTPNWNTGRMLSEFNNTSSESLNEALDQPKSPMIDITSLDTDDEYQDLVQSPYSPNSPVVLARGKDNSFSDGGAALVVKREPTDLEHALVPPTYIYCAEAQQLIPMASKDLNPPTSDLPLISLLLPASALDNTLLRLVEPVRANQLMELSCQVLGIETFPLAGHGNDFVLSYR